MFQVFTIKLNLIDDALCRLTLFIFTNSGIPVVRIRFSELRDDYTN